MAATNSRPLFILDASVAVKWQLRDEHLVTQADELLLDYRSGTIDLIAPACLSYEVAGAIRKAQRTYRLPAEDALLALQTFLDIRIPVIDDARLIVRAYELKVRIGCSLYDGLYVAVAAMLARPLVHADQHLRNALEGQGISTVWIEDWSLDQAIRLT